MPVTIIAEAGLNWSSYIDAQLLAIKAKECGADIVKYQTHFNWDYPMMYKDNWANLKKFCDSIGIIFMSTAWSFEAIDFLADIGMTHWKIPSTEANNEVYVKKILSKKHIKIFISNGIEKINSLKFNEKDSYKYYQLSCISKYPAKLNEIDFRNIFYCNNIRGFSDHTDGIIAPIIAVGCGAKVIEKHFCLSHPCIDDAVSITPDKFKEMVDVIRQLENYKEPVIPPEILALKNRVQS